MSAPISKKTIFGAPQNYKETALKRGKKPRGYRGGARFFKSSFIDRSSVPGSKAKSAGCWSLSCDCSGFSGRSNRCYIRKFRALSLERTVCLVCTCETRITGVRFSQLEFFSLWKPRVPLGSQLLYRVMQKSPLPHYTSTKHHLCNFRTDWGKYSKFLWVLVQSH